MVANIDECRNATVEGLRQRLVNLETSQKPLTEMNKRLRTTLESAKDLGSMESKHKEFIGKFLDVREQVLDFVQHWRDDMEEYAVLKKQVKCSHSPDLLSRLNSLYK